MLYPLSYWAAISCTTHDSFPYHGISRPYQRVLHPKVTLREVSAFANTAIGFPKAYAASAGDATLPALKATLATPS